MKFSNWYPRDLAVTGISLFFWGIGEGMFQIFQPVYLEQWGANPVEIGAILGGMGIAMTVVQAPAGYLADRVGSRPVMWSSWILGTAAAAIMALANSLPVFVAGMLTYGLTSFVVAPMNSYITSVRGRLSVERSLTITMALFFFGAFIGSFIGGAVGDAFSLKAIYQISAVIFLLSTLIILTARPAPVEEHAELHAGRPNLAKNPRFLGLLVLIMVTMFALYLPQPLTPNYLKNFHSLSNQSLGWMSAANSLGNVILMLGLGFLSGPAGFIAGQVLVALFAFFLWRGDQTPLFLLGYFCLGGYRLSRSMVLAYARSFVKPNEVGFAFGLVETGNAISNILAPVAAGLLYQSSPEFMFTASLVAIGLALAANLVFLPKQAPVPTPAASHTTPTGGVNAP